MGPIVLYSNGNQECERAKTLLESLHVQIQEYKLDNHFTERSFVSEFGEEAEYPQVAIGYKHIGGLKDTLHFFQDNKLI
jgi:glutaredoxin